MGDVGFFAELFVLLKIFSCADFASAATGVPVAGTSLLVVAVVVVGTDCSCAVKADVWVLVSFVGVVAGPFKEACLAKVDR